MGKRLKTTNALGYIRLATTGWALLASACAAEGVPAAREALDPNILAELEPFGIGDVEVHPDRYVLLGFEGDVVGEVRSEAHATVSVLDGHEARTTYEAGSAIVSCDGEPIATDLDASASLPISESPCTTAMFVGQLLLHTDAVDDGTGRVERTLGEGESRSLLLEGPRRAVVCAYDPTTGLGACVDTSGQCSFVNGVYLGSPCLGTGGIFLCRRSCSDFYA